MPNWSPQVWLKIRPTKICKHCTTYWKALSRIYTLWYINMYNKGKPTTVLKINVCPLMFSIYWILEIKLSQYWLNFDYYHHNCCTKGTFNITFHFPPFYFCTAFAHFLHHLPGPTHCWPVLHSATAGNWHLQPHMQPCQLHCQYSSTRTTGNWR